MADTRENKEPEKRELNDKQERFCQEYLIDMNATQAAIRAGYSKATAYSQGHRLLRNAEIKSRVNESLKASAMGAEEVLMRLSNIAKTDINDFYDEDNQLKPIKDIPAHARSALAGIETQHKELVGFKNPETGEEKKIEEVTTKVRIRDTIKALELLGKRHALFADKVEHSGTLRLEDLVGGSMEDERKAKEGKDDGSTA